MILFLIGAAITTVIVLSSRNNVLKTVISIILEICFVGALLANVVLVNNVPPGYKKLDSLGYITENGYIEILEGEYYTAGSKYFLRDDSNCDWIPFKVPEFEEVEISDTLIPDIK